MAQHTILQVKQDRSGIRDADESTYAPWWSLADLLVQLGETGSLSSSHARPVFDDGKIEAKANTQRQRRITLAPGTVLPAAHLSALSMESETLSLLEGEQRPPVTDLGDSLVSKSKPTAGYTDPRNPRNMWRASTGRIDFSSAQLEELRGILEKPQQPAISAPLQKVQPTTGAVAISENKVDDKRPSLHPTAVSTEALLNQRRASKSNVAMLKGFWRVASGSQRSTGNVNFQTPVSGVGRSALPKSQTRPSLASIFRRSSGKVTMIPVSTPVRMSTDITRSEMKDDSVSSASVLSEKCGSPQSSLSDWDSSSQMDDRRLFPPELVGSASPQHQSEIVSLRPDTELTITRSESRKVLVGLGRGPSPAAETKPAGLQTEFTSCPSDFSRFAASTKPEVSTADHKSHLPVLLTPASLPPLLAKLNDVTRHCKAHLEVISERLTKVDTRASRSILQG